MRFRARFHWRTTYVVCTSSAQQLCIKPTGFPVGLGGTERIYLKSIEHGYIRIVKVSVLQAMGSSTVVRHERQEMSSTVSPRVGGSNPVRGNFFAEFILLIQFWQI